MHNLKLGPDPPRAERYGAANGPHEGLKLGSQKGVILASQNEPKSGVSPMVYLHAGLDMASAIPYAIHLESDADSHVLGSQKSVCHSAWC